MKDFNKFLEGRERKDEHSGLQQRGWSPEPSRRGLFPPGPTLSQALDLERTDAVESRCQRGAESHRLMATCILIFLPIQLHCGGLILKDSHLDMS